MKVGERGQVTIPKEIRDKFDLRPNTAVDFQLVNGEIVLRKTARPGVFRKWRGKCKKFSTDAGNASVDRFIEDVRGR